MNVSNSQYLRFPCVLKEKLISGEIILPDETKFTYEKILVYRAVERTEDDKRPITNDDFKSYYELKKGPKKPKGNIENNPKYYGVSSYTERKIAEQIMHFPRPSKKIAKGYVYDEGGPEYTEDKHICWWIYDKVEINGFYLMEANDE